MSLNVDGHTNGSLRIFPRKVAVSLLRVGAIALASGMLHSPSARAQTSADLSLSKTVVDAGDTILLTMTVDKAPTYGGNITVYFYPQHGVDNNPLAFRGNLDKGQQTVSLKLQIPVDTSGGTYTANDARFMISNETVLKVAPLSLTVKPIADLVRPSEATLLLNFSQRQLLETQISELSRIRDDLSANIPENATDTPSLRTTLADAVDAADNVALQGAKKYAKLSGKSLTSPPIFFEDFHRHYQLLSLYLRRVTTQNSFSQPGKGKLVFVQLKGRKQPKAAESNISGVSLPVVTAVIEWFNRNIAAISKLVETNTDKFSISFASIPSGASVSFTRIGELPAELTKSTNIGNQDFPLAMWTFTFVEDGCKTESRSPDPYIEHGPLSLTVELSCKKR